MNRQVAMDAKDAEGRKEGQGVIAQAGWMRRRPPGWMPIARGHGREYRHRTSPPNQFGATRQKPVETGCGGAEGGEPWNQIGVVRSAGVKPPPILAPESIRGLPGGNPLKRVGVWR